VSQEIQSLQQLVGEKTLEKKRNRLLAEMRRDVGLRLLCLAPLLGFVEMKQEALAEFSGLSPEAVANHILSFLQVGLWVKDENGSIRLAKKELLNLGDASAREHLSATVGIISNLSETGPCWYQSSVVATSQELKREFYASVRDAFRNFVKKSAALERYDSVVAWSHQGFDSRAGWNKGQEDEEYVQ
jgi:hypothetical protein